VAHPFYKHQKETAFGNFTLKCWYISGYFKVLRDLMSLLRWVWRFRCVCCFHHQNSKFLPDNMAQQARKQPNFMALLLL
jgi:hypothetical protein